MTLPIFAVAFIFIVGSSNPLLGVVVALLMYMVFRLARRIGKTGQAGDFQDDAVPLHIPAENEKALASTKSTHVSTEQAYAISSPPEVANFSNPAEVVQDDRLSMEEKNDVLKQWECDELALARAGNEGMSSDDGLQPDLSAVKVAQTKLYDMALLDAQDRHRDSTPGHNPPT